jgi:outer membrane protein
MATAQQLNAQTEKGKTLLGGQTKLEYSTFNATWETDYNSGSSGKTRSLEIDPQIGRFIANNFAVGIEIPYNRNKDIDGDDSYTTSSLMVMPFARYYFGKTKVKPYLHGAIGPGWGKTKTDISMGTNYETKFNLTGYEAAGGLGVFLNQYISLDFSLGYGKLVTKWTDSSNVGRTDNVKGIDFNIGIVVCL